MLTMRGRGHFTDGDVDDVAKLALAGLIKQPANPLLHFLLAAPAIQNNNPDHDCDHQRATES